MSPDTRPNPTLWSPYSVPRKRRLGVGASNRPLTTRPTATTSTSTRSPTPNDGRYRVSKRLIRVLAAETDWWCRRTFVDRSLVDPASFGGSHAIEYNKWLADLIRWRTRRAGYEYHVTIAHRQPLRTDKFIRERLQEELTKRRRDEGLPKVQLDTVLAKNDRLLQVADLLASGVRQLYLPSQNAMKIELAHDLRNLIQEEGRSGNRRISRFEWKPKPRTN